MESIENKELINKDNISTKYGLIAGILMAASLLIFQLSGNDYSPYLKLITYIILIVPIVLALNLYKEKLKDGIFMKGFSLGAKMSMIAGLILVVFNIALYIIAPELSFSKFSIEATSWSGVSLISAALFFETFVLGSVITFITIQYLKVKSRS